MLMLLKTMTLNLKAQEQDNNCVSHMEIIDKKCGHKFLFWQGDSYVMDTEPPKDQNQKLENENDKN